MRKGVRYLALALCLLALTVVSASAQKKTKTTSTTRKTTTSTAPLLPPLDVRAAREKVDIQLSNVNGFLAKLGPLAPDLETAIADQKAGKLKPVTSQAIDKARANLIQSIHDIGLALNALESEFRTKPVLARYLPAVQGITDLGGKSQDSAAAGQFVAAKDPLRDVVKKLTDTLAAMPR